MYGYSMLTGRNDVGPAQGVGSMLLAEDELQALFCNLRGAYRLMAEILYATGSRLEELLAVRVRDVECEGWCLVVRGVGGVGDRRLRLPRRLRDGLLAHLGRLQAWHQQELARGGGEVAEVPDQSGGHPLGGRRWCWQFVFPSTREHVDETTGRKVRSHLDPGAVQAMLGQGGRAAGLAKPVHAQALRHAFALNYLEKGRPLPDLQRLLGHANLATTMRYVEVLRMATRQGSPSDLPAADQGPGGRWAGRAVEGALFRMAMAG